MVLALLQAWQAAPAHDSFQHWCAARSDDALAALCDRIAVAA